MNTETIASGSPITPALPYPNWKRPIGHLAAALARAQANYPPIIKDKVATIKSEKTGAQYNYRYADWGQILEKIRPCLAEQELAFVQMIAHQDGKQYLVSMILHSSGEVLESDGLLLPGQLQPRESGAYMTYFKKYDGSALLGVAAEDESQDPLPPVREKATRKPPEIESLVPAVTLAPIDPAKLDRRKCLMKIREYSAVVGADALKAYVLRETAESDVKDITTEEYKAVLVKLDAAALVSAEAVQKLVEGKDNVN